jgi:hypothetical protein
MGTGFFAGWFIDNKYILVIEKNILPNGWRLRHSKPALLLLQQNFYISIF